MRRLPSLRRLQLFRLLGEEFNYHRTAQKANIAQPALTRAIQQLEDELGFALFTRTTRSTQFTSAGRLLHAQVDRLIGELSSAIQECRDLAKGTRHLIIGYSAQAAPGKMSARLFQFGVRHTDVQISLRQMPSEMAYAAVAASELHGAFVIRDEDSLRALNLHAVQLEQLSLVVLCALHHPLARQRRIRAADLSRWGIAIGSEARWKIFRKIVLNHLARLGWDPKISYQADDTPLLLEAISRGTCLGVYGSAICDHLPHNIVAKPLPGESPLDICFVTQQSPTAMTTQLKDFLATGK